MLAMMIRPMLGAMGLGILVILAATFVSEPKALVLFAVLLGATAGVNVGFGLADGRSWEQGLEISVALVLFVVAAFGLWVSPLVIAGGFMAHAVWDLLHHPRRISTFVTPWYPPICALFDMVMAAYIGIRWMDF